MRKEKDFEEFLRLLNKHRVKYCIVGAYAVGLYAEPRYTKDLDILIEPSLENGGKIIKALKDFGFANLKLAPADFTTKREIVQLGYEPVRIDLITSIEGCDFNEVWKNKKQEQYGSVKAYVIGLNELMRSKKASARPQDRVDLKKLSSIKKK
jgi:hypothetical protein